MDPYADLPYASHSFPETHPEQLAALASLFGVTGAPLEACRVLELGCASGGNLIPLAWHLPQAEFVGIDLSPTQIEAGRDAITRLGLGNIELRCADVAQVELGDTGFDYIIAQGLYSWVPAATRTAILQLLRRQLRPAGIAYLSFNALPGWRMRSALRDMLRYHAQDEVSPSDKTAAAREFLEFLGEALEGQEGPDAGYLRHEHKRLSAAADSYLYHEFLTELNEPLLFADFARSAEASGLGYLCNAELQFELADRLDDAVALRLNLIPDRIERQQYLDFLQNRSFHQALLVRSELPHHPAADLEQFSRLSFFADLHPPARLDLARQKPQTFTDRTGERISVRHPLSKAALTLLASRYPEAIRYPELEAAAVRMVRSEGDRRLADQPEHLFGEQFSLFARRQLLATPWPGGSLTAPAAPPLASKLARLLAERRQLVDSRHQTLYLDATNAALLGLTDGSRDVATLQQALAAGNTPVESVPQSLAELARYAVFHPRPGP